MTLLQAILLGFFQGFAELFPISSLAQIILLPALLGWDFRNEHDKFMAFLVALHLATATALVIYFWKEWKTVLLAFAGSCKRRTLVYDQASKFAWLLVAGTIIVGLAGLVLEKKLRPLYNDANKCGWIVATVLILNGFMMMGADVLKKRREKRAAKQAAAEELTFTQATLVGAAQTFALVPGISRSGITIVGGLLAGLSYEQATRFSFMLATPVIGLAALKKVPELLTLESRHMLHLTIPAALVAGITAYLSTAFLMRYFKQNRLAPFGWFCVVFGTLCLMLLK